MVYRLSDAQFDRFSQYSFGNGPKVDYGSTFPQYPNFSQFPQTYPQVEQPKQKVGFFEGLKAIGKGLLKPLAEIVKHPIKSGLMIAATAALVIGTGGAATPFLIAGGFALGGWQVAKGAVGAIMSDNRAETLANLEDIGSGTFAVAASAVGAKTYMSTTAAGSATATVSEQAGFWAKAGTYAKALGQDAWNVIKMAPESAKATLAMIKSGQFMGNLQSVYASTRLAVQHRGVAKARALGQDTYQAKLDAYNAARAKVADAMATKQEAVFNKYVDMANAKNSPIIQDNATGLIDNGFTEIPSTRYALRHLNPLRNNTSENMGVAIGGNIGTTEEQIEEMMPYAQALFGTI